MEDPAEFNRILIAEIKEEMAATGLPFEDLFFERLSGSLEAEGEIETADRVPFEGAASGKTGQGRIRIPARGSALPATASR